MGNDMGDVMTKFLCKCKTHSTWISEGDETQLCPSCGRRYKGKYNRKKLTIEGIEIKNGCKNITEGI